MQALFAAVYLGTAAARGDAADAAFLLFALGFLLMIAGDFTAGVSLIRTGTEPSVGALLLVAAVAAVVLIVTPYLVHDVALFSFRRGLDRDRERARPAGEVASRRGASVGAG